MGSENGGRGGGGRHRADQGCSPDDRRGNPSTDESHAGSSPCAPHSPPGDDLLRLRHPPVIPLRDGLPRRSPETGKYTDIISRLDRPVNGDAEWRRRVIRAKRPDRF